MPLEALILRRVFPVPVTFADLRRAQESDKHFGMGYLDSWSVLKHSKADKRKGKVLARWHSAIKEATGALDEVYAVIDGREVRVAVLTSADRDGTCGWSGYNLDTLIIAADEAGYWQRPHEVRVDLDESQMSHKTMARIAGDSFAAAKRMYAADAGAALSAALDAASEDAK